MTNKEKTFTVDGMKKEVSRIRWADKKTVSSTTLQVVLFTVFFAVFFILVDLLVVTGGGLLNG